MGSIPQKATVRGSNPLNSAPTCATRSWSSVTVSSTAEDSQAQVNGAHDGPNVTGAAASTRRQVIPTRVSSRTRNTVSP